MSLLQSAADEVSFGSPAVVVAFPVAPTPGNLIIASVTCFNNFSAVGAGFTDSGVTVTDANNGVCRLLYRYAQIGDTASQALATSNSAFWCASICEVDNVSGVWATDFEQAVTGSSTASTFSTTLLNTLNDDDLAVIGVQCAGISVLTGAFDVSWVEGAIDDTGYTVGSASKLLGATGAPVQCDLTWTHANTATYIVVVLNGAGPSDTPDAADRVTQVARMTLAAMAVSERVTQLARMTLAEMTAATRVTQVARLTLAAYGPCHTRRAQLWKITRTDGLQLAYTSHDRPIPYGALTYSPCDSLQGTASQQSAEVDGIGNVELQGIISDDGISELDIEAGKYDDAYVEVFMVAWQDPQDGVVSVDSVYRLVAGWVGTVSAGERGFIMEVLGPGQRLAQKTILNVYAPGCRWNLGDANCGVDIDALKLTGTVTAVTDNGEFILDVSPATADAQFDQGFVRWLTGDNAGVDTEIKTVAFETGDQALVVLWAIAPFLPQVGDTVEVFPGCDRSATTCSDIYDNKLEFGGFDKVPGNDEISKTPDAKF